MEITSFALGMLTMIAVAFAIVVVIGLLKVNKHTKEIANLHKGLDQAVRDYHQDLHMWRTDLELEIKRVELDCKSYTDSRLDKKLGLTGSKSQKGNDLITS
jgi:hypothetical protein